ncbi:thioredoxin-like protein [Linderina pennispora]|uniref:Thioredoxin-like protein n=1 Tax=Linderina pennispora TaxID=61395 RepID=A0A1Y1W5W8_9FUNG|nr:thioredoxin-like protein [Linderina pennispora]ORX68594.1 thioredoxin-like protein [Linderina pennispora]
MAKEDKRIEEAAVDQSAGVAPVDKPEAGRIKKSGKKGKKFATKVSGIEEMRLEKKMKRQQVVKSLTKEKEKKSMERKSKIGRKLAKLLEKTMQKRRAKKQAKKSPGKAGLSRTLSAINREWDSDEIASTRAATNKPEPASDPQLQALRIAGDEFDRALQGTRNIMVLFHTPSCVYCNKMAPEYGKLAAGFEGSHDVRIATVDSSRDRDLSHKFDVHAYPTILLLADNGKRTIKYDRLRTAKDMASFIKDKTGVASPKPV